MERVVIVGGGFAGLQAAKWLARRPVEVVLVDRQNHHVFQPLLYQVASAVLAPEEIAIPIRSVLRRNRSVRVVLDEVTDLNIAARTVRTRQSSIGYDYLILAPGSLTSYFGHREWEQYATSLKTLEDAIEIRRRVLTAFELAEQANSLQAREALLNFVIIGGGPTGVELAGALAEIAMQTLRHDFHDIRPDEARITLLEGSDRILRAFPEDLSRYAERKLRSMGVRMRLGSHVQAIGDGYVEVDGERISTRTVLWAAGVSPSPLCRSAGVPCDAAGRVQVAPDLSLPGHPEVFVVGDAASVCHDGAQLPGVAPVAMQQGRAAAANVWRRICGGDARPFRYREKGNLATIGKFSAVAYRRSTRVAGPLAWLVWLVVHILYLAGFENRLLVLIRWAWAYAVYQRGARLIYGSKSSAGFAQGAQTHTPE